MPDDSGLQTPEESLPRRSHLDDEDDDQDTRTAIEGTRPILVITAGVQGVGKSTFAKALAPRIGATIVSSDVLKVEVGGVILKEGMLDYYTEVGRDYMRKLYDALLRKCQAYLTSGRSVICEAAFERREDRARARDLAAQAGVSFLAVECLCWETVRYHRLRRRLEAAGREDLIDETWRIYVDHARRYEEFLDEVPPESHVVIETSLRLEDWVDYVADRVDLLRRAPPEEVAELARRSARPSRILIVDDDAQFLDVLDSILTEDGFEVTRAKSGGEAIELFDRGEYDLVVTDQRMPGASGVELTHHVKEVRPDTPVIMVSAFGAGEVGKPEDEGIFRFLKKPVRLPTLMGAVEEALSPEHHPKGGGA